MTTHILVTGATGLLGCTLVPELEARGYIVTRHGFHSTAQVQADLCSYAETAVMLEQCRPDCIINLVGLTNVDTCELDPHSAYLLNVVTVQNLCCWIKRETSDCHLIQISTDQLYDTLGPHRETEVTIRNSYAFSKIAAEIAAASVNSSILRTNFFGRSRCTKRVSFSDWIYQSLHQQLPLQVFEDVLFSPLSSSTLCNMIELVVQQRPLGIFNLGSRDGLSKADFAYALAEELGLPRQTMRRIRLSDMTTLKAHRPKDMRMDSSQFEQHFGLQLPKLIDEIISIRSQYLESA
ncbi:dTDP-4-dehydrorhamnose reductase family protein [Candidatus Methylobacter oryzae]|uniref:dTDP-4-dehydrorhamnose reductase family protein n=1 Tax=Candidatus Methylobacter oryzae TaxID=2497749 RepID=UPI00138718AD|nr:SDR family oxidoreductase [Candidatus Methylobacter oryzae]